MSQVIHIPYLRQRQRQVPFDAYPKSKAQPPALAEFSFGDYPKVDPDFLPYVGSRSAADLTPGAAEAAILGAASPVSEAVSVAESMSGPTL